MFPKVMPGLSSGILSVWWVPFLHLFLAIQNKCNYFLYWKQNQCILKEFNCEKVKQIKMHLFYRSSEKINK